MVVVFCLVLTHGVFSRAQDASPDLTLIAEHDIGLDCPVSTTVQPETDVLWVLMDNCGGRGFSLRTYDLNSGAPTNDVPMMLDAIDGDLYSVYGFNTPMAFMPDGSGLQLFIANDEDDTFTRVQIDLDSGDVTLDAEAAAQFNTLFGQFTEYPAFAVTFSPDHLYAVVAADDGTLYILDLDTQELLFDLMVPGTFATLSPDAQQLYVTTPEDPDDFENFEGTIAVYSLPDGALIQEIQLRQSVVYPSPDGRYLAFQTLAPEVGNEQLGVVEIASGSMSPLLNIGEEPKQVTTCLNNGNDVSDLDYRTTGDLFLAGLHWLPDSSGFVTVNAYGTAQDSSGCIMDYSRLRQYQVTGD
jgi:WD40 repeat protein